MEKEIKNHLNDLEKSITSHMDKFEKNIIDDFSIRFTKFEKNIKK